MNIEDNPIDYYKNRITIYQTLRIKVNLLVIRDSTKNLILDLIDNKIKELECLLTIEQNNLKLGL